MGRYFQLGTMTDEDDLMVMIMRGVQTDHLLYGLNACPDEWAIAEKTCDEIIREKVNPDWKSDPKWDDWWR